MCGLNITVRKPSSLQLPLGLLEFSLGEGEALKMMTLEETCLTKSGWRLEV